jgi:aminoglycoside 2'-N-acetyltransferase I
MEIHIVPGDLLGPTREHVFALCERAYLQDLRAIPGTFDRPTHVLGIVDGALVSHALWITRWLAPGTSAPLRTAYVEWVATDPAHQRRGYASAVMRALMGAIDDFQLAALSTSDLGRSLYARLGWEPWRGPLFIREPAGAVATPGETVMIRRLARTPSLSLDDSLSAEWREGEVW